MRITLIISYIRLMRHICDLCKLCRTHRIFCTENGSRTRTAITDQGILSPLRLPFRHLGIQYLFLTFSLQEQLKEIKNAIMKKISCGVRIRTWISWVMRGPGWLSSYHAQYTPRYRLMFETPSSIVIWKRYRFHNSLNNYYYRLEQ